MAGIKARAGYGFAALALWSSIAVAESQSGHQTSTLIIIATMHGLHKNHPGYDYQQLYALIRGLHPDLVGVEIRAEDMASERAYLAKNYPTEMIALADEYGPKAFGFDWLGEDVAGKPVADKWWSEGSPIKRLEREQSKDLKYQETRAEQEIGEKQHEILAHATPLSLNDGRYDALTEQRYDLLRRRLADSPYAAISKFYAERDRQLCRHIVEVIRANPGKRIVVATGADHRFALVKCVPDTLADAVRLESISHRPAPEVATTRPNGA
jgi:hypothetical protein